MPRLRRSFTVPVLAAGLMLLGACGTSVPTTTKATTTGDAATTTVAGGKSKSTTTDAKNSPTTTTKSADTKPSKSDGKVKLTGSFCDMIEQVDDIGDDIFGADDITDPDAILQSIKETYATMADVMRQLQAKAPAEIKADIDFTVQAFEKLNDQLQSVSSYDDLDMEAMMGADFDSPEAQQHSDALEAYAKDKCGIDTNVD